MRKLTCNIFMSYNIFIIFFFCIYKNVQNNKERLQEKACERYQCLSKEEKEKKATIWS